MYVTYNLHSYSSNHSCPVAMDSIIDTINIIGINIIWNDIMVINESLNLLRRKGDKAAVARL